MNTVLTQGMELLRRLERAGFESVLVGGAVRDLLLGRSPEDIDIATEAPFTSLADLFPDGKAVGPEGTRVFLVARGGSLCEITSYCGRSLELDLARRDFTVNALALRSTGEIVGTRHSRRDIALRMLRFNGRCVDRLGEDPLRALRLSRFAATLPSFSVASTAISGVRAAAPSLARCAPERIGREMRLGLAGDPHIFLRVLAASRMFHILHPLFGEEDGGLLRLLAALKRLDDEDDSLLRRMALIASFRRGASFPDVKGAAAAQCILREWKWPRELCSGTADLVRWREAPGRSIPLVEMASLLRARGISFWSSLFALAEATSRDAVARRRIAANRERFIRLALRFGAESERIPSGGELMERLSLLSSPEVGRLLRELQMEHLLRGFSSKEEALERASALSRGHSSPETDDRPENAEKKRRM